MKITKFNNKNATILLYFIIYSFLLIALGMLLIIIGLPQTCNNYALYSLERIKEGKIFIILCFLFSGLFMSVIFKLYKQKE